MQKATELGKVLLGRYICILARSSHDIRPKHLSLSPPYGCEQGIQMCVSDTPPMQLTPLEGSKRSN